MTEQVDHFQSTLADRYVVERELGRGGMAVVYLALDRKLDRRVALKVLRPELAAALGADRFLREIEIAAKLTHPHILPLYDSGEADGRLFYVMPYVEGESLRDRLDRERQLGLEDALQIVREVGSALAHAHAMGLVHRDIKPENILLSGGHAVVADFGIARAVSAAGGERLTETGLSVGTPHYMSPEQAAGEKTIDGRSDEYALACVLYELLVGQPPFTGPTAMAVIARHTLDPVPSVRTVRSAIDATLEAALMKALAKVPADRFATVQQFVETVTGKTDVRTQPALGRVGLRRTWVKPVGIGFAAAVALTIAVISGRRLDFGVVATPDSATRIAVLDFQGLGLDTLRYLTEAIPEFLSLALTGETGGPKAIDRRVVTRASRAAEGTTNDPVQRRLRVADHVGATHVVTGEVIQQARDSVLIRATLWKGREQMTDARVMGASDEVGTLIEQVGVQLLATSAGQFERLPGLMASSTEAVQLWLAGQQAYREGEFQRAVELQWEALNRDSTFALAAWGMMKSAQWLEQMQPWERRGARLAWDHRDRLPRADSTIFDAEWHRNRTAGVWIGERGAFKLYQRAVQQYPERWDAWLLYGDYLWHEGGIFIDDGRAMAVDAFQRALRLDSLGHDEPWQHLEEHYQMTADWEALAQLPERHRGRLSEILQALGEGDSLQPSTWEELERSDQLPIHAIILLQASGTAMWAAERLAGILERRAAVGDGNAAQIAGRFWLVRGRPSKGIRLLRIAESSPGCGGRCQDPTMWVHHGLFGELPADSAAAVREALRSDIARRQPADIMADGDVQPGFWSTLEQSAWLALWSLRGGRTEGAEETARFARQAEQLASPRRAHNAGLYARLLEAAVAVERETDGRVAAVLMLDSAFGMGDPARRHAAAWLVVQAELFERIGRPEQALAIIRRQWMQGGEEMAYLLPARLLLRARLATQVGLPDEAIQAYRHYLTLRSDPEPEMADQVAAVRQELTALVGEGASRS